MNIPEWDLGSFDFFPFLPETLGPDNFLLPSVQCIDPHPER
jgi:hypothetical protein